MGWEEALKVCILLCHAEGMRHEIWLEADRTRERLARIIEAALSIRVTTSRCVTLLELGNTVGPITAVTTHYEGGSLANRVGLNFLVIFLILINLFLLLFSGVLLMLRGRIMVEFLAGPFVGLRRGEDPVCRLSFKLGRMVSIKLAAKDVFEIWHFNPVNGVNILAHSPSAQLVPIDTSLKLPKHTFLFKFNVTLFLTSVFIRGHIPFVFFVFCLLKVFNIGHGTPTGRFLTISCD